MVKLFNKNPLSVVGVMSGTSLDGLDICLAHFEKKSDSWAYTIEAANTVPYSAEAKIKLSDIEKLTAWEISKLDYDYGHFIGKEVFSFLKQINRHADVVASHGHTAFHNPGMGYTFQIGKGAAIVAETGIPCISDFRAADICRNGQGAPLVPIGDKLLFTSYDICLNLGGIANISFDNVDNERVACDVAPCNMLLNFLSLQLGMEYDAYGNAGAKGMVNHDLLNRLNELEFYGLLGPKSLGREWFEQKVVPVLASCNASLQDKLRTAYEHIAIQISKSTAEISPGAMLVTGGGARNRFLVQLITEKVKHRVVVPENMLVDFKEALIFAFLAALFLNGTPSALASSTGATADSISGCLYL